jgi:hypothetical protein
MRARRWRTLIGLTLALGMIALPAAAGGDEPAVRTAPTQISGPGATGFDYHPAAAIAPAFGDGLVVWADDRNGESEIWGRRVNTATGAPMGDDFRISPANTEPNISDQYAPAVAYSATSDVYLVVWNHAYTPTDTDVLAQRVYGSGALKGGFINVANSTSDEYDPDVAWSTKTNQWLVVWVDGSSPPKMDIHGQRIRANGNFAGAEIAVTSAAAGDAEDEYSPALAYNSVKSQYQVVFTDTRYGMTDWDVRGQRIRDNGNRIGNSFLITVDSNMQYNPDIAFDPYEFEYYVVWCDERRKSVDIYGQLLSSYGRLRGGQRRIGLGSGDDWDPVVSASATVGNTNNRYLVAWTDGLWVPDYDIRGRYVSSAGIVQGASEFGIMTTTASQHTAAMPPLSQPVTGSPTDGSFLIVWTDDEGGSSLDIWGKMHP